MTSKKLSYLLIACIAAICLVIIGGAYEINSLLKGRSDKLLQLKADAASLDQKQVQVLADKQNLKKYADLNTIARTIVPQDKNSDIVVRQIINLAKSSGIGDITGGITLPSSTLGGSGSASSTASNPNSSLNNLTQLTKVKGLSGVYDMPIQVQQTSSVTYSAFVTFITNLQNNRRTANISDLSIQPDAGHPNKVTFNLTIDEYIKP